MSVRQFDHCDLPSVVGEVLAETGMPADQLCLEMTESVLMTDTEENLAQLVRLKAARRHGWPSTTSAPATRRWRTCAGSRSTPSRSTARSSSGSAARPGDAALVSTIVQLGQSLGMATVAEGIEEFGQLAALREMGCDFAQGLLLLRPGARRQAGLLLQDPFENSGPPP